MAPQGEDIDFAVVGGGTVGASVAYGLQRRGKRVLVIDNDDTSLRASRANFSLVWVQGKGRGNPAYASLTRRAALGWGSFAQELQRESGIDVQFRQPGGFTVALSEEELELRRQILSEVFEETGHDDLGGEILDPARLASMQPGFGPEVTGASYCALDGHCNSLRLLRALLTGFTRAGGQLLTGAAVQGITPRDGGFEIAFADGRRPLRVPRVVLAAGLGSRALAEGLGITAPLTPLKGQIVVTEKLAPFMNHPVVNIRQSEEGGVMIGGSMEPEKGFDTRSDVGVTGRMTARAIRVFPRLAEVRAVRMWAGLRIMTPDGLPIYQRSPEHPGAVLVSCHSGVTLASFHAGALAEQLAAEAPFEEALQPFAAGRFHVPQVA